MLPFINVSFSYAGDMNNLLYKVGSVGWGGFQERHVCEGGGSRHFRFRSALMVPAG